MFEKLMISGLRRQNNLLENLIEELEKRPSFDDVDLSLYETRTRQVAQNLRKLRRIKKNYFAVGLYTDFT